MTGWAGHGEAKEGRKIIPHRAGPGPSPALCPPNELLLVCLLSFARSMVHGGVIDGRPSRLIAPRTWMLSAVPGSPGNPESHPWPSRCSSPQGTHLDPSEGAGEPAKAPGMGPGLYSEDPKNGRGLRQHLPIPRDTWGHQAQPPPFVSAACQAARREGRRAGSDRSIN